MVWWSSEPRLDELMAMDYATHIRMRSAVNIYDTLVKLRTYKDERIHLLTDSERRILKSLLDSGYNLLD